VLKARQYANNKARKNAARPTGVQQPSAHRHPPSAPLASILQGTHPPSVAATRAPSAGTSRNVIFRPEASGQQRRVRTTSPLPSSAAPTRAPSAGRKRSAPAYPAPEDQQHLVRINIVQPLPPSAASRAPPGGHPTKLTSQQASNKQERRVQFREPPPQRHADSSILPEPSARPSAPPSGHPENPIAHSDSGWQPRRVRYLQHPSHHHAELPESSAEQLAPPTGLPGNLSTEPAPDIPDPFAPFCISTNRGRPLPLYQPAPGFRLVYPALRGAARYLTANTDTTWRPW